MRISFFLVITALLSACSSLPKVYSDFDKQYDFSANKTFSWAGDTPIYVNSDYVISPFTTDTLEQVAIAELASKGYTYVNDSSSSDFLVAFTIGARDKLVIRESIAPLTNIERWTWGHQYYRVDSLRTEQSLNQYVEGTLAIDIFDTKHKKPVWHGYGKQRLSSKELKGTTESLPSAVKLILANFPSTL